MNNDWFDWRMPRGGVAWIAGMFMFAGLVLPILDGDSWFSRGVAPVFFPLGLGLWFKHAWARWITFAFFVLCACLVPIVMLLDGLSTRRVVQTILLIGSLVALWQWQVYPEDEAD